MVQTMKYLATLTICLTWATFVHAGATLKEAPAIPMAMAASDLFIAAILIAYLAKNSSKPLNLRFPFCSGSKHTPA